MYEREPFKLFLILITGFWGLIETTDTRAQNNITGSKPNSSLLYVDNSGYSDASGYDATSIRTSPVDRLVGKGLFCTRTHALPVTTCTSSGYPVFAGQPSTVNTGKITTVASINMPLTTGTDTIFVKGTKIPAAIGPSTEEAFILTPKPGPAPGINGPKVYGCRPGHPFIYRIPVTGTRPMHFSAKSLPEGLRLDKDNGIITGTINCPGNYTVVLQAENKSGKDSRLFKIVCGEKLALTPPMGWNDWYAHYGRITEKMMRQAADLLVSTGMADAGYQYVNIDDCWMNAQKNDDPGRVGPPRDTAGNILPNSYFPDMKGLTDYIHSKGLKAGIYTSPGATTCGGFTGSFGHEAQDARQFAAWGFDFLKYDYCSYENLENQIKALCPGITSKQLMQRPYFNMGDILRAQNRDMMLNLCQYGRNEVWTWGAESGSSWRTGGDLGGGLDQLFEVALTNADYGQWVKPGAWNDPDYIQIGYVGNVNGEGLPELTKMHPSEQYSFMSLWCMLAAPLFYSGDLTRLNDFTLNILCNTEVIAVDQDPLGRCARVVGRQGDTFILVKDLEDGSKAVGLFNKGKTAAQVEVKWADADMAGVSQKVRDLWRQKDLGTFQDRYAVTIPSRGVILIKVSNDKRK